MMSERSFAIIAEKIHCTRIFKRGGNLVTTLDDGTDVVVYRSGEEERHLPIPAHFKETAQWRKGSIKHCAVAIWQGVYGDDAGTQAGVDYIQALARSQEADGASFLDINVDEFSTDVGERERLMAWTVGAAQEVTRVPMSIDSSNTAILRAGLAACDPARGKPMINSVSLEREDAVALAGEFRAAVIASAAGRERMPATTQERLANLAELMPGLLAAGVAPGDTHVDPLVFPISTDTANGKGFLDAVAGIRETYGPEIHITGGFSNVSFGMPNRKLINQVFTALAVDAGADSGIVDPGQINGKILAGLDRQSEGFQLAKTLLTGEDEYGMAFIAATREGKI
jgi:5-methyltetrahydrofolate--homocysteine methyltransferase